MGKIHIAEFHSTQNIVWKAKGKCKKKGINSLAKMFMEKEHWNRLP